MPIRTKADVDSNDNGVCSSFYASRDDREKNFIVLDYRYFINEKDLPYFMWLSDYPAGNLWSGLKRENDDDDSRGNLNNYDNENVEVFDLHWCSYADIAQQSLMYPNIS